MAQSHDYRFPQFPWMSQLFRLTGVLSKPPVIPPDFHLKGLREPVDVQWDVHQVPHIKASHRQDAMIVQGYIHGFLRSFQMDFLRRMPVGELSEILGPGGLPYDTFMRRLNLRHWAQKSVTLWNQTTRESIDAYTLGVNQALEEAPLAPEYRVLKMRPRPWVIEDTSLITYFLSWSLNSIWTTKWGYETFKGDPELKDWMFGPLVNTPTITIIPGTGNPASWGSLGIGSNNWVVNGAHTHDGNPLLANDPHLAPQLPSIWFELGIKGGGLDVFGVSLPGAPGVIIGKNQDIAWGVTNVDPDCQDLFRIRMDGDDQYRLDGDLVKLESVKELIHVRGQADVTIIREQSHAGPIIHREADGSRIALAWTGFGPLTTINAVLRINRATDWHSFLNALEEWTVPAQNFVYADRAGHIGYALGGFIPTRPEGPWLACANGNTRTTGWTDHIAWEDMPRILDPESGYIVTANNAVLGDEGTPRFFASSSLGYRAARIDSLLRNTSDHDLTTFSAIQQDVYSKPLRELSERLLKESALPARWHEPLAAFDGRATQESITPTLLYLFLLAATPKAIQEALNRPFFDDISPSLPGTHPFPETFWGIMGERHAPLILQNWERIQVTQAILDAETIGQQWFGPNINTWSWGKAHQVTLFHPFIQVAILKPVFGRKPIPVGGDFYTPLQTAFSLAPDLPWPRPIAYLPSYRQILSPAHPENSRAIHLTGQSGHPLSPHYDDLLPGYLLGHLEPIVAEKDSGHVSHITPQDHHIDKRQDKGI